ncbi:DUF6193 family natural product biosynthesis protein [Streptomyces abikoensis]|uniref:DUF6193 family natural product biosynthesis protein n=1 Tax=Streptomyces abikoensis TaxID=97398 RepID=UPI0036C6BF32
MIRQQTVFDDDTWDVHSHGTTTTVGAAWHEVLVTAGAPSLPTGSPQLEPSVELVRVTRDEPLLRQLYPWTGTWELHFSRCTESRYTWGIPYVRTLGDGRYCVGGPSRSSPWIVETYSALAAIRSSIACHRAVARLASGVPRDWARTTRPRAAGGRFGVTTAAT